MLSISQYSSTYGNRFYHSVCLPLLASACFKMFAFQLCDTLSITTARLMDFVVTIHVHVVFRLFLGGWYRGREDELELACLHTW